MSEHVNAYTVVKLAPGSYDVLLGGSLIAALVRGIDGGGDSSDNDWRIDLFDEIAPAKRPAPFTEQTHVFPTCTAALEWLGISEVVGSGIRFRDRKDALAAE